MRVKKKIMSLLLSICLTASLLPITAAANEGNRTESGTETSAAVVAVQDLMDALPDAEAITQENVTLVKEQLETIEHARESLSAEEQALLDCTRYQTVKDTLLALENIENTALFIGETGDLTVTEGTLGTDYTYEEHILTILTDKELTISGTTQEDQILIQGGGYMRR